VGLPNDQTVGKDIGKTRVELNQTTTFIYKHRKTGRKVQQMIAIIFNEMKFEAKPAAY